MTKFSEKITERTWPSGTTCINHRVRVMMDLTLTEYCILDLIIKRKSMGKDVTYTTIENSLGIPVDTITKATKLLEQKQMIKYDNKFFLNPETVKRLKVLEEGQYASEFEVFWMMKKDDKNVVAWPGPRKDAYEKFVTARKQFSLEFIMKQRENYFKYLVIHPWRQKMIASKFLNVKTGQIEEDFLAQIKTESTEVKRDEKITSKQKEELFK